MSTTRRSGDAAPRQPKPAARYAGLTVAECCKTCGPGGCAISGTTFCGHPRKAGATNCQHSTEAQQRFLEASKVLGKKQLDARFS